MITPEIANQLKSPAEAPRAPGLPLLGNSLQMLEDPMRYLVEQYHEHGSVFRLRMGFKDYVVLAGIEANRLLATKEAEHLTSKTLFGDFQAYLNTDIMMPALDGAEHNHMRKLLRPGFSRSTAGEAVKDFIHFVDTRRQQWRIGDTVSALEQSRRIVVDQIGQVTAHMPPGDYFEDILTFINSALNIEVLKTLPRVMWKLPKKRRAEARVTELGHKVLQWHRDNPPEASGRRRDSIDDVLDSVRPDGKPFTEADLQMLASSPYFAGMDTVASTFSYTLYALAKHPEIYQRAKAEVEAAFADGIPDMNTFRNMPIVHAIAVETLRLYPTAPFSPRYVVKPLEFDGYLLPEGTELMFAQTVTHFLEEYYPDPFTFNIDRHIDSDKSRPANVFAPFTVGKHTCLGAGFAEVQLMATTAAMLYYFDFELESPDYEVKIKTMPLPNPGNDFRVRITGIRQ